LRLLTFNMGGRKKPALFWNYMITKANILIRVNKICKRNETNIDDILLEVLQKISKRTLSLKDEATSVTVAGQNYINKPSDMVGNTIEGLVVDGQRIDPISFQQFINSSACGYCVWNDKIYTYPAFSTAKAYTLYYSKLHPSDLSTILFPDEYEEVIRRLTAALLYEKYELYDGMTAQLTLYENEIKGFIGYNSTPPIAQNNAQEM
jgi:hypothetical protein